MSFTPINLGAQQGNPTVAVVTPEYVPSFSGFFNRAKQSFAERDANVQQIKADTKDRPLTGIYRTAGQVGGLVGDVTTDFFSEGLRPEAKEKIKSGFQAVLQTKPAQNAMAQYASWKEANPDAAANLEATVNIASVLPLVSGPRTLMAGVRAQGAAADATIASVRSVAAPVTNVVKNTASKTTGLVTPKPTPSAAVGQVLQAKKPLTPRDVDAFRNIDTSNVKTYADLDKQVDTSISRLSSEVDEVLGQDPTPIPLNQLVTRTTSGSGKVVERNFVETALQNLKELYTKIADDVAAVDIDDMLSKAQTTGLTRLEVNNLSRMYNREFGSKAFSKLDEPLTSVNAQAYENIRSGLKDVARQGLGGGEAAAKDAIISSLYNVRTLVKKNVEAVQRLEQKINKRGLLEKAGHAITTAVDTLSGGLLRGLVSGMIMRGQGFKVMNALDLEANLQRNLKIIDDAIESGSDDALINAAKELQRSLPNPTPAPKSVPSAKPTMLERGKALFNKVKTEGKRGFVAMPGKRKPDIHPDDLYVMERFISYASAKGDDISEAMYDSAWKLAEKFGISMDLGTARVANEFKKVLSGTRKAPDTVVKSSPTTASKPSTAKNTSTGSAPTGKGGVSAQRAGTSGPFDGVSSDKLKGRFIHETNADFSDFDIRKVGKNTGESWFGTGAYLQKEGTFKLEKYGAIKKPFELPPNTKIFDALNLQEYASDKGLLSTKVKEAIADGSSWTPKELFDGNWIAGPRGMENRIQTALIKDGYDGIMVGDELVLYNSKALKPSSPSTPKGKHKQPHDDLGRFTEK